MFDWREERPGAEGQSDEGLHQLKQRERMLSDGWVIATATRVQEVDVEPFEYDLDISREVEAHLLSREKQMTVLLGQFVDRVGRT